MTRLDMLGGREVAISRVEESEKPVLRRLLELHQCEISVYTKREISAFGEFG